MRFVKIGFADFRDAPSARILFAPIPVTCVGIHECGILSMLLHIRLLASTLGGSSGGELAWPRCIGDRGAARRWAAGGPQEADANFDYNCNHL